MKRYIESAFTSERIYDRVPLRNNDTEPLTEKENNRLEYLIEKVDRSGSPSALTEKELEEYNRLGKRRNITDGMIGKVSLPTAIKPWITQ
jgi:hypothetical protein